MIIFSRIMMKFHTSIDLIFNFLTRIALERIEIIYVLLVKLSELPTLIKCFIRSILSNRLLSAMPNFILNAAREI